MKLPPLFSTQDHILRSVFIRQKARELRSLSILVLAQNGKFDKVLELFRDHTDDLLYSEQLRKAEEKSLRDAYDEMKNTSPLVSRQKDGSLLVTGL